MQRVVSRIGVLAIAPLLIMLVSGCGWEPLRTPTPKPGDPQQPQIPQSLQVEIVYDCKNCVASQSESTSGEAPLAATFSANVTLPNADESVLYYGWDFADGTLAEGAEIEHTFENPGTYRVNVRIITSSGKEARDQELVIVYPQTQPSGEIKVYREEGTLCSFERIMPATIYKGVPFKVQVIIITKQPVQVLQWEDNIWFPQFRLKQEPSGVWLMLETGQRISLEYEVEMWQPPTAKDVWMSGEVSCNAGGLGNSEILEIRSDLNSIIQ